MAIERGGQYGLGGRRQSMAKQKVTTVHMDGHQKPQQKKTAFRTEVNRELKDAQVKGKIVQKDCITIATRLLIKLKVGSTSSLGTTIKSLCNGLANKEFNSDVFGKYDPDEGCFLKDDDECGTLKGKQLPTSDAMHCFFDFAQKNEIFFEKLKEKGGSITDIESDFLSAANDVIGQFIMDQSSKTSSSKSPYDRSSINWA